MKAEDSQAVPMVQLTNMRDCFFALRSPTHLPDEFALRLIRLSFTVLSRVKRHYTAPATSRGESGRFFLSIQKKTQKRTVALTTQLTG